MSTVQLPAAIPVSSEELHAMPLPEHGPRANPTRGNPVESMHTFFEDGRTISGIWECTPGRFPVKRGNTHSVFYVLAGDATVYDADGAVNELRPGSVLVEPAGWTGEWDIRETVRKLYFITVQNGD